MDIASILIIAGICILCLLPVVVRSFRRFDKSADDLEGQHPDVAKAIREARRNIDRGKGRYGPWLYLWTLLPVSCSAERSAFRSPHLVAKGTLAVLGL